MLLKAKKIGPEFLDVGVANLMAESYSVLWCYSNIRNHNVICLLLAVLILELQNTMDENTLV